MNNQIVRNLLSFLLCFFLIANQCASQCNDLIKQTGTGLLDVHVFSDGEMIASGSDGHIIKSKDGGSTWRPITSTNTSSYIIRNMFFSSDSVGFAVGSINTVLKTEDKGETWMALYVPGNSFAFNDVFFINDSIGFITGDPDGHLLKTTDGGRNWNLFKIFHERLTSIAFSTDSTGFITGPSGTIYSTKDTGRTWKDVKFTTNRYSSRLNKIYFLNATTGFAVGENGIIIKTTDGGASWTQQLNNSDTYFFDVLFIDQNIGLAVGGFNSAEVYRTTNGGATWLHQSTGIRGSVFAAAIDRINNKVVLVGSQGAGNTGYGRNISTSTNNGVTWKKESGNTSLEYYVVQYLNDSAIYIAGEESRIYKSKDKGESWRELGFVSPNIIHKGFFFLNESRGFLFNNKDLYNGDEIYETRDSGYTWTRNIFADTPINSNDRGRKIYFWDSLKGIAIKHSGVYKTADGGASWVKKADRSINPSSFDYFHDGSFNARNGKGYIISFFGKVFITEDYGETWKYINLNNENEVFQTVYMFNDSIGYIGGNQGLIYKTTDGGKSWKKSSNGISGWNVVGFHFTDAANGFISCNNNGGTGALYQTADTSKNWTLVRQTDEIHQIAGNKQFYITVGDRGTIIKNYSQSPPVIPGYIVGDLQGCVDDKKIYATGLVGNQDYQWKLSGGGTSTFLRNMDTITWTTPGFHTLQVATKNQCGQSPIRSTTINIVDFKPVISVIGNTLSVTEGEKYQWYINTYTRVPDSLGGKSRTIEPKVQGVYSVEVKSRFGCSRTTTPYNFSIVTGISSIPIQDVLKAYPNPAKQDVYLKLPFILHNKRLKIIIYNSQGQQIKSFTKQGLNGELKISLLRFGSGEYFINVFDNNKRYLSKIVVL